MALPVDASHWPRPLDHSFARLTLRKQLVEAGFTPAGVVFYPPSNPELGDDEVLYKGEDGREYARRIREGHATEVFISPDGSAAAEIDTRYRADLVWLATLFEDGSVLWTSNEPERKPRTVFYEPDPSDLSQLDPESRARLESAMGCFRAENLIGDVDAALHIPHPWAGLDIQIVPRLDLAQLMEAHRTRAAESSKSAVPGSLAVLLAATDRAIEVQRFRERFALVTGGAAILGTWLALAAAIWILFEGAFFWGALCIGGPTGLILGLTGFFMWPTRVGVPLATWVPLPSRNPARTVLEAIEARPQASPPEPKEP